MRLSEGILYLPNHATGVSTEQTSMRTKWFKHIVICIVREHLLVMVVATATLTPPTAAPVRSSASGVRVADSEPAGAGFYTPLVL